MNASTGQVKVITNRVFHPTNSVFDTSKKVAAFYKRGKGIPWRSRRRRTERRINYTFLRHILIGYEGKMNR